MNISLSADDVKRIERCDYYLRSKQILESYKHYIDMQIGEVFVIKHQGGSYITRGDGLTAKFIVVHKDDNFIFAKRINASGNLSVDIECLTIEYPQPLYQIELDPAMVESILLDKGDYDPALENKKLQAKKNMARKENKKIQINYVDPKEAKAHLDSLKVGDHIYSASTTYGKAITEWTVKSINKRPTDKTKSNSWGTTTYGNTYEDQRHNEHNIDSFTLIELSESSSTWTSKITFLNFMSTTYSPYYRSVPVSIEEL